MPPVRRPGSTGHGPKPHEPFDRLGRSRNGFWVMVSAILVPLLILACATIGIRQKALQQTTTLIARLNLSTPALIPSGRVLRDAGYANPAIDLRHGPHLPLHVLSPEDLLFDGSTTGQRNAP